MKKILILGSAGMLGHVVCRYFEDLGKYEVLDTSYPTKFRENSVVLDVTDADELRLFLETVRPDFVINCIGMLIKGSHADHANAIYLNAYLPYFLSKIIHTWGGKLFHISTDCVFSGDKGNYTESDRKDANDIYGASKSLGEIINDQDITIRTSIIGPELKENGEGLFHWFMNQNGIVQGFTKVFWSGITTLELAKGIEAAIDQNITGLINISAKQKISKYDLLVTIQNIYKLFDVSIVPFENKVEDKSLISERTDFKFVVHEYPEMIEELFHFMKGNPELYLKNYAFLLKKNANPNKY